MGNSLLAGKNDIRIVNRIIPVPPLGDATTTGRWASVYVCVMSASMCVADDIFKSVVSKC